MKQFFKDAVKETDVFISDLMSYFTYCKITACEKIAGFFYSDLLYIIPEGYACFCFKLSADEELDNVQGTFFVD